MMKTLHVASNALAHSHSHAITHARNHARTHALTHVPELVDEHVREGAGVEEVARGLIYSEHNNRYII